MDLPAGNIGDEISFIDYAGTFDSNALTIDQNGSEKIAWINRSFNSINRKSSKYFGIRR